MPKQRRGVLAHFGSIFDTFWHHFSEQFSDAVFWGAVRQIRKACPADTGLPRGSVVAGGGQAAPRWRLPSLPVTESRGVFDTPCARKGRGGSKGAQRQAATVPNGISGKVFPVIFFTPRRHF